jgi:DNA-3-methyladenine glycosylase
MPNGSELRYRIIETEAYRGAEDLACHASKGRTPRTEIMFQEGGLVYVYLIYGIHWLLNVVTGDMNEPQAVLIRVLDQGLNGPGKLTKVLEIDKSFYGEDLVTSHRMWIEDDGSKPEIEYRKRVGIDYAGDIWKNKLWRFVANI